MGRQRGDAVRRDRQSLAVAGQPRIRAQLADPPSVYRPAQPPASRLAGTPSPPGCAIVAAHVQPMLPGLFRMNIVLLLAGLLLAAAAHALPPQTPAAPILAAKSYLLYDYTSDQILVSQNADAHMEPASLTKLMTAYLVFDALKHGTLSPRQNLTVPAAALRTASGESRMLLKAGQDVTVDDLRSEE